MLYSTIGVLDMNSTIEEIWKKQSWETDTSYEYFEKFYLMQAPPRSVTRGYHRYLVDKRGWDEEKASTRNAPGNWQKWSQGKRNNGEMASPDAKTWKERAEEYDKHREGMTDDVIRENRDKLLLEEQNDAKMQLDLWRLLSESLFETIRREKLEADKKGEAFDPIRYITKAKDLWKFREELTTFLRRTYLLPDKIREDGMVDPEDLTPEINWQEVDFETKDIGVGAEEVASAERMMELMTRGKDANEEA